jgi:hypothetical protein
MPRQVTSSTIRGRVVQYATELPGIVRAVAGYGSPGAGGVLVALDLA